MAVTASIFKLLDKNMLWSLSVNWTRRDKAAGRRPRILRSVLSLLQPTAKLLLLAVTNEINGLRSHRRALRNKHSNTLPSPQKHLCIIELLYKRMRSSQIGKLK